jgi:DnaJ homolog subfamily C member 28
VSTKQNKGEDERDDAHPLRRAVTSNNFESVVDQLLGQARSKGQFDNLPGQGRPLQEDAEEALVPPELRTGFRMLKNAGFAPPWVEARRSIEADRAQLGIWLTQTNARWPRLDEPARAKLRAEYRRKLEDLQREILNHNLTAPESAGQIPGVQLALELAKLG